MRRKFFMPCQKCGNAFLTGTPSKKFCSEKCYLASVVGERPADPNECWIWNGPKHDFGYGYYIFDGTRRYAHAWSYETYVGGIPNGLVVRHKCRNPACVQPSHLDVGTTGDNMQDKIRDGTTGKGKRKPSVEGEKHPRAYLTAKEVLEILRSEEPNGVLAERYGTAAAMPWMIKKGYCWNSVTGLPHPKKSHIRASQIITVS